MALGTRTGGLTDDLFTDRNGPSRRLRVDPGQTGFFAGREFRTFKEISLASGAGQLYIVKIVTPVNVVFHSASFTVDSGGMRVKSYDGTPTITGAFSETLPVIPKNRMSEVPQPAPTPLVELTAIPSGGTFSGGRVLDVIRLVAGGGQSSTVEAVGGGDDAERGACPGTYYFVFENLGSGAVTGTFHAHWEERPA